MSHESKAVSAARLVSSAAQRFPVGTFLAVAVPLSLAISTVFALIQYQVLPGRDVVLALHDDLEEVASLVGVVAVFASAVAVTALTGGRTAVRELLSRTLRWRAAPGWWLIAVLALPVSTVGIALLLGDQAHRPSTSVLLVEMVDILIALLLINLWEEAAWAGFMQTRLMERHSLVVAAALTALPFSLVHMPLRVITGEATTVGELMTSFLVLTVFLFVFRALLGAVLRGSASVLLVAVTHTFFNRSNNTEGVAADVLTGDQRSGAALLATILVTGIIVTWQTLRRRRPRTEAFAHTDCDVHGC